MFNFEYLMLFLNLMLYNNCVCVLQCHQTLNIIDFKCTSHLKNHYKLMLFSNFHLIMFDIVIVNYLLFLAKEFESKFFES